MESKDIEFKDFPKAISTEEFIAILEIIKGVNENFEKALIKREERHQLSEKKLEEVTKEFGKYSKDVINARKVHRALINVTTEDISKGYSLFLNNYNGIIEFLTRFSMCDSIKPRDIKPFIKKKTTKKEK